MVNAYAVIRSKRLCDAITKERLLAKLNGASLSTVDLDARTFPRLTARIRRDQALYGWPKLGCGKVLAPIRVMSEPNGPVIRVYWPG